MKNTIEDIKEWGRSDLATAVARVRRDNQPERGLGFVDLYSVIANDRNTYRVRYAFSSRAANHFNPYEYSAKTYLACVKALLRYSYPLRNGQPMEEYASYGESAERYSSKAVGCVMTLCEAYKNQIEQGLANKFYFTERLKNALTNSHGFLISQNDALSLENKVAIANEGIRLIRMFTSLSKKLDKICRSGMRFLSYDDENSLNEMRNYFIRKINEFDGKCHDGSLFEDEHKIKKQEVSFIGKVKYFFKNWR